MTAKQGATQFGVANIITIIIVLCSAVGNYMYLSAKVDGLDDRLAQEVIDRKVEDKSIRLEIDNFYYRNIEEHKQMLEGLNGIQKDLTYHRGLHEGGKDSVN